MNETIERIGVCKFKGIEAAALFHRVKVKLSRKYRVWPVLGNDRSILIDPSEFTDRFQIVQQYKPEGGAA